MLRGTEKEMLAIKLQLIAHRQQLQIIRCMRLIYLLLGAELYNALCDQCGDSSPQSIVDRRSSSTCGGSTSYIVPGSFNLDSNGNVLGGVRTPSVDITYIVLITMLL